MGEYGAPATIRKRRGASALQLFCSPGLHFRGVDRSDADSWIIQPIRSIPGNSDGDQSLAGPLSFAVGMALDLFFPDRCPDYVLGSTARTQLGIGRSPAATSTAAFRPRFIEPPGPASVVVHFFEAMTRL